MFSTKSTKFLADWQYSCHRVSTKDLMVCTVTAKTYIMRVRLGKARLSSCIFISKYGEELIDVPREGAMENRRIGNVMENGVKKC